jgi:hypothetical protein
MSRNKTSGMPPRNRTLVTEAEWFAGGQRVWHDPESARVQTGTQAAVTATALRVFERIAGTGHGADEDTVGLTMLPGRVPRGVAVRPAQTNASCSRAGRAVAARGGEGSPAVGGSPGACSRSTSAPGRRRATSAARRCRHHRTTRTQRARPPRARARRVVRARDRTRPRGGIRMMIDEKPAADVGLRRVIRANLLAVVSK